MRRLILTMMAMCMTGAAYAQPPDARSTAEGVVVARSESLAASAASAVQAVPPASGPRRRPSMVGYIDDSSISNKFRVRFDIGTDLEAPDRAEFFYAKCGCYQDLPRTNPNYDPDAPGPRPGVLSKANFNEYHIFGEYALNGRFSLVGNLPIRSLKPQEFVPGTGSFGDSSGIGDLRFGAKLSLASDSTSQITLQVMALTPTGDSEQGLGTHHWSIDPSILYSTQLGERANIEAVFGTVLPTDGSAGLPTTSPDKFAGKVIYYGVGPSVDVYTNGITHVAPVVELVGWHVVDGFSTSAGGPANGTDIFNIKIGGRIAAGPNSIYVGWGKALTDSAWYDQILRFEYRYGF
jgi:outer membrane putative beta-barrel porin/alpha-amylase